MGSWGVKVELVSGSSEKQAVMSKCRHFDKSMAHYSANPHRRFGQNKTRGYLDFC
jgi:hypothetical protein